ncbi:hypothetical protein THAOC_10557 [Thalassiosira oceanica]|uniref:Uncharacterized protein n=1 Tax=Thalassiosira oceanica TaxID=159749 RepID=K0SSB5_THAOC|nr:hypothetical protein THAOC_10557 [Thalassiosira oceanica]|eukprot:EJK68280.1 hypothetical protein THAOC_10557 [Thalassiosira oceanica]
MNSLAAHSAWCGGGSAPARGRREEETFRGGGGGRPRRARGRSPQHRPPTGSSSNGASRVSRIPTQLPVGPVAKKKTRGGGGEASKDRLERRAGRLFMKKRHPAGEGRRP